MENQKTQIKSKVIVSAKVGTVLKRARYSCCKKHSRQQKHVQKKHIDQFDHIYMS